MSGREKETERVASSSSQIGFFYQTGEYWTLGLGGATFPLKDLKGLGYVQRLLQHPREEFHALDLLRGLALVGEESVGSDAPDDEGHDDDGARLDPRRFRPLDEGTHRVGGLGDAGALLDSQAKKQDRRAIEILEDQLEELRERDEHEGSSRGSTEPRRTCVGRDPSPGRRGLESRADRGGWKAETS